MGRSWWGRGLDSHRSHAETSTLVPEVNPKPRFKPLQRLQSMRQISNQVILDRSRCRSFSLLPPPLGGVHVTYHAWTSVFQEYGALIYSHPGLMPEAYFPLRLSTRPHSLACNIMVGWYAKLVALACSKMIRLAERCMNGTILLASDCHTDRHISFSTSTIILTLSHMMVFN